MNITITEEQFKIIRSSLYGSATRADEQAALALRNDFHDAKQSNAYYVKLAADCREIASLIEIQAAPAESDDNDETCPECGEDYGYCQCEEDDDHA